MTTLQEALRTGIQTLTQANQEQPDLALEPRLDARVLLAHVLGVERSFLYTYPERPLTPEQEKHYHGLLARRMQGEPVAYLVGNREFYGLDFLVDRRVLIPRPETELLVEAALKACRQRLAKGAVPLVADIGTGSGIIPITLAVQEPRLPCLYATDISAEALEVAALNCQRHHVEKRVHLLQGDLLAPLPEAVDILTANLPYVGTKEMSLLTRDVRAYEPHLALFSGPNGLDLLQRLFTELKQFRTLLPGGSIFLEIGYAQRESLESLVRKHWSQAQITWIQDYAGWYRVLQVDFPDVSR